MKDHPTTTHDPSCGGCLELLERLGRIEGEAQAAHHSAEQAWAALVGLAGKFQRGDPVDLEALTVPQLHQAVQDGIRRLDRRTAVAEFMGALDQPVGASPALPESSQVLVLRLDLILEEVLELFEACQVDPHVLEGVRKVLRVAFQSVLIHSWDEREALVGLADACTDLKYVVEGLELTCGIDADAVWDEVHRSNMKKLGGPRRADGKILKPAGWQPPDVEGCLVAQGMQSRPIRTGISVTAHEEDDPS